MVVLFTGWGLYQIITFHTRNALDLVANYSRSLLEHTYSTIKHPMEVGDSDTVEAQFEDIKKSMQGVEVYVTDFRQGISYASEKDRVHTPMSSLLAPAGHSAGPTDTLRTGVVPEKTFTESTGAASYLVALKPVLNEQTCHHCHGASQKVLGAMIVKQPVTDIFASLAAARTRLLVFYAIEIIGIILLLHLVLSRLVSRRIRFLAEQTSKVSAETLPWKSGMIRAIPSGVDTQFQPDDQKHA